jgi:addiction module HigA family antidote
MPARRCPLHPGQVARDMLSRKYGANISRLAALVGVSRSMLWRVLNCRAAVKAGLAIGLAKVLHLRAETWLRMQATYDLWCVRCRSAVGS